MEFSPLNKKISSRTFRLEKKDTVESTLSPKPYTSFSLLDISKGLLLVRVAPDFPPVEFSLTHFPLRDSSLDVSLTDFPPASSKSSKGQGNNTGTHNGAH